MGAHKRPEGTEGLLTTDELCKEWLCDKNSISYWVSLGMPTIKKENRRFYDLKECQRWYRGEKKK